MNRNRHSIFCGRSWIGPALVMAIAVLLVFGQAGAALAGPAQEKGQEEQKEKNKDKSKKYTNDDLKKGPTSSSGGEEVAANDEEAGEPGAEDASVEQEDPWDSVGVATDSQGRGEEFWRQAMADARAAVDGARKTRDGLQSEMNRRQADFSAIDDPAARDRVNERIQELFDLLAEAEQAISDNEKALSDLGEDARRSGALPGWLR